MTYLEGMKKNSSGIRYSWAGFIWFMFFYDMLDTDGRGGGKKGSVKEGMEVGRKKRCERGREERRKGRRKNGRMEMSRSFTLILSATTSSPSLVLNFPTFTFYFSTPLCSPLSSPSFLYRFFSFLLFLQAYDSVFKWRDVESRTR